MFVEHARGLVRHLQANEKPFSPRGFAGLERPFCNVGATRRDPPSRYLQRHKAVGVPLYVVYSRGGGEGRILPVILTPAIAERALAQAAGGR